MLPLPRSPMSNMSEHEHEGGQPQELSPEEREQLERLRQQDRQYEQPAPPTSPTPGDSPLGRVQVAMSPEDARKELVDMTNEAGWKPLDLSLLPTGGMFLPEHSTLMIRAASVNLIKQWSTIDATDDQLYALDHIYRLLSKCTKLVRTDGKVGSYKDLADDDKMFLIFVIRELTFAQQENRLRVHQTCSECGHAEPYDLGTQHLQFKEIEPKILRFYDPTERCFILPAVPQLDNQEVRIYQKSIGSQEAAVAYMQRRSRQKRQPDIAFADLVGYLIDDWRRYKGTGEDIDRRFEKLRDEINGWSKDKVAAVLNLVSGIQQTWQLYSQKSCSNCGTEVQTPLNFSLKGLFIESDILDRLFG